MASQAVEVLSLCVIGIAVMLGGTALLAEFSRLHVVAAVLLGFAAMALLFEARRALRAAGARARIRVSRDVAFVAALVAAIAFVTAPARWSAGAAIVAFEFGLVLELLGRFAPQSPPV